jgi:hypothetical protein
MEGTHPLPGFVLFPGGIFLYRWSRPRDGLFLRLLLGTGYGHHLGSLFNTLSLAGVPRTEIFLLLDKHLDLPAFSPGNCCLLIGLVLGIPLLLVPRVGRISPGLPPLSSLMLNPVVFNEFRFWFLSVLSFLGHILP